MSIICYCKIYVYRTEDALWIDYRLCWWWWWCVSFFCLFLFFSDMGFYEQNWGISNAVCKVNNYIIVFSQWHSGLWQRVCGSFYSRMHKKTVIFKIWQRMSKTTEHMENSNWASCDKWMSVLFWVAVNTEVRGSKVMLFAFFEGMATLEQIFLSKIHRPCFSLKQFNICQVWNLRCNCYMSGKVKT
jgi:hypothetical protein